MRLSSAVTVLAISASFSACKKNESERLADFRRGMVDACKESHGSYGVSEAKAGSFCGCLVDRYMKGRGIKELRDLNTSQRSAESTQLQAEAATSCKHQVGGASS